jgi:ferrous iron transport protein B
MYYRIKGFLLEAVPVVLAGVLLVNLLVYAHLFEAVTGIFAPLIQGLFGLPKEAVVALAIGFVRKDVAAGMLMPLGLSAKQLFIAATLLAMSFPCIASFVVLGKELGMRALCKSTALMIGASIIVGTLLNIAIR